MFILNNNKEIAHCAKRTPDLEVCTFLHVLTMFLPIAKYFSLYGSPSEAPINAKSPPEI